MKYLQLVENRWDRQKKRPLTRILCNFGRIDRLKEDEVRAIAEKLLLYLKAGKRDVGEDFCVVQSWEWGLLYLVERLWKKLKLDVFMRQQLRKHKYEMPLERAILGMLFNRLQQPDSKLGTYQWLKEETYFPVEKQFELHHVYRALDFLESHHQELEEALYFRLCNLFNRQVDLVFFDTTSTYFEIRDTDADDLRQYGHAHGHRSDRPQILVALAVNRDGLPLASEVFSGNTADVTSLRKMVERMKGLGVGECIFVSDRGTVSEENLKLLKEVGFDYIVGVKLRSGTEVREEVLKAEVAFQEISENLRVKEVQIGEHRYVVCLTPSEGRKDRALREKWIQRLEELLPDLNSSQKHIHEVLTHPVMKRLCCQNAAGQWVINEQKVRDEERCDGIYVVRSSKGELSADQIATGYKSLHRVEEAFHYLKSFVELRPCYHYSQLRIKGHVLICVLAYLLERFMELHTGYQWSQIQRAFRKIHAAQIRVKGQSLIERSELDPLCSSILKKMKLGYPSKILSTSS